jgi:division protein CdvB (Snf7/Vps24/ESCRT-III family)
VNEVQQHAKFPQKTLNKINYYYVLRNSLIHQRATVLITDDQVQDYRETIERVLKKLFGVKFPD